MRVLAYLNPVSRGEIFGLSATQKPGLGQAGQDSAKTRARTGATGRTAIGLSTALVVMGSVAHGQEALHSSLAGEDAAKARQLAANPDYYNLSAGDMGTEFTDNVFYTDTGRQADMIFRPGARIQAWWPVTDRNTLNFATGIGYKMYLKNSTLNAPYVTPDSNLSFQMYTGDFVFDCHDRFSAVDDVVQNSTLSGTHKIGWIENTLGANADWDLNNVVLSLGYDHYTMLSTYSDYDYIAHSSELLTARAAYLINSTTKAGLETGGGVTSYDQSILHDSTHFSVGPFYEAKLTDYISTKLAGGFVSYSFSPLDSGKNLASVNQYYAALSITHRLNAWFDHSLSAGRQAQPEITIELLDLYYARYQANWRVNEKITLNAHLGYEHGERHSSWQEVLDRYNIGAGFGYQFSKKVSGYFGFDTWIKNSDVQGYNYSQNRVYAELKYAF